MSKLRSFPNQLYSLEETYLAEQATSYLNKRHIICSNLETQTEISIQQQNKIPPKIQYCNVFRMVGTCNIDNRCFSTCVAYRVIHSEILKLEIATVLDKPLHVFCSNILCVTILLPHAPITLPTPAVLL